ncbi:FAD-dependent oxidoreductase [Paracoccus sp. Z330]|uniref:FAD-dependent oxidoreductase n=1 Tax=Paracoccus onchidii TaxID=3017813 RepID=A0ABT4ZE66_9RHOB|nr:bifunctional TVP38/TMEM64 family protein/FAD-dependent oxidoreductase [Paracoccus onchidii]MDB6177641.1 FAD-dependent oxidoreductase [Paracoccus onchidii]
MLRPFIFILLVAAVASAWLVLPTDQLGLDWLRLQISNLRSTIDANPMTAWVSYFLAYVAVAALSLPIALWLTLGAGALFGFGYGLLLVSFAASIGASLAFLASRYLLRDWVQAKLGERAKAIKQGLDRDGAFYLFSLRLVPVFPFFIINLLMGLTRIPALRFYAVSQIGMLPATALYVNAGTQIGQLESLSGILSPEVFLSFALLAVFPWVLRLIQKRLQRRRIYAGHKPPTGFDRNLIVIGAGAAGLVSAYIAAATKAKVTLVEAGEMGGDCLNTGCVPSKALIRSAELAHEMRNADCYGLSPTEPVVPFRKVIDRVHAVIAAIAPHDSVERYEKLGVEVLRGYARIIDPWTVEIALHDGGTRRLTARSLIIATGAQAVVPDIPGLDRVGPLTSDNMWQSLRNRDHAPERMVVLGGGPIGSELAQAFARLGSHVTQIEAGDRLLAKEDPEVSDLVRDAFQQDGIEILLGQTATSAGIDPDGRKWIAVGMGPDEKRIPFDEIIVAVGRAPRLKGFGLEELGVEVSRVVETNEYLETVYPNILAAGDVAGPFQFTHTASHQAWFAAVNALFGNLKRFKADYRVIPWATFTSPQVARVGLSETQAAEQGVEVDVTRYGLDDLDRAIADGGATGFVKVLTAKGKDRILGVTIVGHQAGELIAEFVLAMKHGIGLNKILGTIHIYPTMAEANKQVAGEWRRNNVNPTLLAILARFHAWRRG